MADPVVNPAICFACRFNFETDRPEILRCRRFPPTLFLVGEGLQTEFPIVALEGWCGEFKRKPGLQPGPDEDSK